MAERVDEESSNNEMLNKINQDRARDATQPGTGYVCIAYSCERSSQRCILYFECATIRRLFTFNELQSNQINFLWNELNRICIIYFLFATQQENENMNV